MVVLKNQNRRSGIFYLRPLCGFGFFSKSEVDDPPKIAGRYTLYYIIGDFSSHLRYQLQKKRRERG